MTRSLKTFSFVQMRKMRMVASFIDMVNLPFKMKINHMLQLDQDFIIPN